MNTQITKQYADQLPGLIAKLGDDNGLTRQRARLMLEHIGQESTPALLAVVNSPNPVVRWEAAQALGSLPSYDASIALAHCLMDEDAGVRWVAAEGLIHHGHASMRPLLEVFVKNFDSPWLREGVRHILRVYRDRGRLSELEADLFRKLTRQDIPGFESSWNGEAAWAAEKVLEILDREID